VDLTTRARVKAMIPITHPNDDEIIDQLIADTSARVQRALRRHTQATARTEVYQINRHEKVIWLRGYPVIASGTSSVKYSSTQDFSNITTLTEYDDYNLTDEDGLLRLRINTPLDPGFVEIIYTGGMGTDAADFISNYPEITLAVDHDIIARWKRRANPENDITFAQGGMTFTKQVGTLDDLQEVIEMHKRRSV